MRILLSLVLAAALASAATPLPAAAASHPRVEPGDCGALVAKVGRSRVWQAQFWGHRGGDGFDPYEETFTAPCFSTQSACVDWLYWEQSDWHADTDPGRCKPGMPYSG